LLIEPKAECVHQHGAQQAIAQVPQIPRPHSLEVTTVGQLSKDGVNQIAHPSQNRTVIGRRFGGVGAAYRRVQPQPLAAQNSLQLRQPIATIPEHDPLSALQHQRSDFAIRLIGRSQEQMGDQPRPAHPQVQAKPRKGLPICVIFAEAFSATQAHTTCGHAQSGRQARAYYR
jgi:hypothetical protein